jgi:hypothetical protein
MLEARVGLHQKRQAPKGSVGGLPLQTFANQVRPNSTAPVSTVPEVQDEQAKAWPGAKRRKVRYGPYRIPPISVSTYYLLVSHYLLYFRKKILSRRS